MRRHSNHQGALLTLFTLLICLGMACSQSAQETTVPAVAAAPTPAATPAAQAVDIAGSWKATFSTPDGDLDVTMHIRQSSGGVLSATMDVPVMDAYDIPLVFSFENNVVHWEIQEVGSSFTGRLTDPSTIEGVSSSPDGSISLVFKRIE